MMTMDGRSDMKIPQRMMTTNAEAVQRLRITFSQTGALRYVGHLDMVRTWERGLRRAGVPLAYSGGFHPGPRLLFRLRPAAGRHRPRRDRRRAADRSHGTRSVPGCGWSALAARPEPAPCRRSAAEDAGLAGHAASQRLAGGRTERRAAGCAGRPRRGAAGGRDLHSAANGARASRLTTTCGRWCWPSAMKASRNRAGIAST